MEMEITYFRTLCLGAGPLVVSTSVGCFFSGRGKTWVLMWVNAGTTLVNIILDYGLIFGHWGLPEMGIKGAALATVLAGCFSATVYLALFLRHRYREEFSTLSGWKLESSLFLRLCRYGIPSGIHYFLDASAFMFFIMMVGRLGTLELAATNIAFNINTLAFMPLIGFGIAVSTLVGQWLGANKPEIAAKSTWSGFHVACLYAALFSAAYFFWPQIFLKPFAAQASSSEFLQVGEMTTLLLRFVAVYSIFDALNIIFAAAIKGAGDTRFVMIVNIILSWTIMLIPSYLAIHAFGRGIYAMWTAASCYIIILGLTFLKRFLGGKWKLMRVIEDISHSGITRMPELPVPDAEL
jgi:MATE family multidrug resistance protein